MKYLHCIHLMRLLSTNSCVINTTIWTYLNIHLPKVSDNKATHNNVDTFGYIQKQCKELK